jgi:hypothetical protein
MALTKLVAVLCKAILARFRQHRRVGLMKEWLPSVRFISVKGQPPDVASAPWLLHTLPCAELANHNPRHHRRVGCLMKEIKRTAGSHSFIRHPARR